MSAAIYDDLGSSEAQGLIQRVEVPGAPYHRYRATEASADAERRLRGGADRAPLEYLDGVASQVNTLSFTRLLNTVYDEFPQYATKSLFRRPSPTA